MQKPLRWFDLYFERLISGLLILYLISTAFLEFPLYPAWNHRVQPAEMIFCVAAGVLILGVARGKAKFKTSWTWLDLAVGAYLLVNGLSALGHPTSSSFLEVLGKFYLVGVYFVFRLAIFYQWLSWKGIIQGISLLALVIIVLTFLAYLLLLAGRENMLVIRFVDYPYFGTLYRAKGMLQTPSMFISVVNWCFLFLLTDMFCSSFDWQKSLLLAGLVVCGILSFAKAILLMVLIGAVIWILFFCRRKKLLIASISALILVTYIGATNFIYLPNPQKPTLGNTFLEEQAKADNSHWVSSSYWALKKAAWISGNRNILLGTGPGNFNDELVELKQEGRYPEHLPLYDPHSVWFGAYAETGILGFLGVLAIIIMALKGILSINYSNPFRFGLLLWLLVFIIEGTNGDLMNFRHYWIQFGLIGGLSLTSKNTSIQASCAGFSE